MRSNESIVADASFYLCFLEDIKQPHILIKILDNFLFYLPPAVFDEIKVCKSFFNIRGHANTIQVTGYDYDAILKPFFGRKQLDNGESEAIALAYMRQAINQCNKLILDDGEARSFVEANLPILKAMMIGTVGFIGDCHCISALFQKEEATQLLNLIGNSTFRIKDKDLSNVRKRIAGC